MRTQCFVSIIVLVASPFSCISFSTSQNTCYRHINLSCCDLRTSTTLSAGRERRISTSKDPNDISSAEEKIVADEELARQKRIGQMEHRLRRSASREDRISALEFKQKNSETMPESGSAEYFMTEADLAELEGLLKVRDSFEEQYDAMKFTTDHLEFKSMHNDAFINLSKYCQREKNRLIGATEPEPANMFFLDGPDGGTASALIERGGFDACQCFVANRHESSCNSLKKSGGGLLPDENVCYATASEALTISTPAIFLDNAEGTGADEDDMSIVSYIAKDGKFAHIDFAAYYFDGCGGFVPHVIGMLSAALLRENCGMPSGPIAVGYSLLGGNKDVIGKELAISRALAIIARRRGMRMVHVLDEPLRYGLSPDILKIGGNNDGTFTSWLLLEPEKNAL